MYYLYPYLPLLLDIDAFDNKKVADLWALYPHIKKAGIGNVPNGAIVFWDAHFGPNECGIPLDKIMNDPNFDLLKTFYPKERFTTLGGFPFTISVFEKRNNPKLPGETLLKELTSLNFELPNGADVLNKDTEYGKMLEKPISAFPSQTSKLVFNAAYLSEEVNSKDALVV